MATTNFTIIAFLVLIGLVGISWQQQQQQQPYWIVSSPVAAEDESPVVASEDVISRAPGRLMRQMMQLRPWIADAASDGHEEMQRFEPVAPLPAVDPQPDDQQRPWMLLPAEAPAQQQFQSVMTLPAMVSINGEQEQSVRNPLMQLRPLIVVQDEAQPMKESNPFITVQQDGFQPVMTLPARVPSNDQPLNNPFMQLRPWIVVQDDESQSVKQTRPFITAQQEGFQSVMTLPARVPVNDQTRQSLPSEQQPSNNPFMQLRPWIVVQDDASANKAIIKQTKPFITAQQEGFQPVMTLPARVPINDKSEQSSVNPFMQLRPWIVVQQEGAQAAVTLPASANRKSTAAAPARNSMIQLRPWIPATEQQQEPVVPTRASINSVPVGQNPLMQLRPWFVDSSSSSGSTSGNSKQSKPWLLEEVVVLPATLRFPTRSSSVPGTVNRNNPLMQLRPWFSAQEVLTAGGDEATINNNNRLRPWFTVPVPYTINSVASPQAYNQLVTDESIPPVRAQPPFIIQVEDPSLLQPAVKTSCQSAQLKENEQAEAEARTKLGLNNNNNNVGVSLVKSSKLDLSPVTIYNKETVTITTTISNAYCLSSQVGAGPGAGEPSPVCSSLRKRRSVDDDAILHMEGHSISPSLVEKMLRTALPSEEFAEPIEPLLESSIGASGERGPMQRFLALDPQNKLRSTVTVNVTVPVYETAFNLPADPTAITFAGGNCIPLCLATLSRCPAPVADG